METKIQIFENADFGQIRICISNDKEWFCLSDVCKALDITTPAKVKHRLAMRGMNTIHTPTYNQHGTMVMQEMTYIDEPNLFRCIFQSRKAEAEQFQNWVFDVVLPQIRKTGGYIPLCEDDDEMAILAKGMLVAKRTIELKDKLIKAMKPKALFADAVSASNDSILIRDLAKLITKNGIMIGQTRMFEWLREKGYLFKRETRPKQEWVEKGLFETCVSLIPTHHGLRERITTKVTGKGQRYFLDGFISGKFCTPPSRY